MQGRFAFEHLHKPRQAFLQPHFISSLQTNDASGIDVHLGLHRLSESSHPHSPGVGITGFKTVAWAQKNPACYAARSACCSRASCVGGMFPRLRPLENRERRPSLMLLNLLVRSYQRMTNRSIVSKCSCYNSSGTDESNPKIAVTDGQMFISRRQTFSPFQKRLTLYHIR